MKTRYDLKENSGRLVKSGCLTLRERQIAEIDTDKVVKIYNKAAKALDRFEKYQENKKKYRNNIVLF